MSIVKPEYHIQVHEWLMTAIAFTLPFNMHLNTWLIIGAFIHGIISGQFISSLQQAFKLRHIQVLWLFFLLFLLSYFMSVNKHEAMAMIERRASLFVFPLLFYFYPIHERMIYRIQKAFVLACVLAGIFCMGMALYTYINTYTLENFFYHKLSQPIGMNAVYMSAYCLLSLIFLQQLKTIIPLYLRLFAGILLFVFMVLLSSKLMILLAGPVLLLPYFHSFKLKQGVLLIVALSIALAAVIFMQPQLKSRFYNEFNSQTDVIYKEHFQYNTPFTGTTLRLTLWRFSFEILTEKKAWLSGCGSGDFQDLLNNKYKQTGMYTGNPKLADRGYLGYGPHNTYIETLLSLGIIGLITILYLIYLYGKAYVKSRNVTGIQFLVLMIPFFFTESVLSVNKGIVAFTFFALLFASSKIKTQSR